MKTLIFVSLIGAIICAAFQSRVVFAAAPVKRATSVQAAGQQASAPLTKPDDGFFGLHTGYGQLWSHEFKKVLLVDFFFSLLLLVMAVKFIIDVKGDKTPHY